MVPTLLRTALAAMLLAAAPLQAAADIEDDCTQSANPELRIQGCTSVLESGKWEGADQVWAYNNRGLARYDRGEYQMAIDDYDRALELNPLDPGVLDNRGNAYALLGNLEQALRDHTRAIEIDATREKPWNNRAADYMDLGDFANALSDLDMALEIKPDYGDALKNRARVRCRLSLYRGAVDDWLDAIRIGGYPPMALQSLLQQAGYYKGPVNGNFDADSTRALRVWVRDGCRR